LLKKKTVPGKPNHYAPCPSKLDELIKDVKFKYREQRKIKKYKDKYDGNYELYKHYNYEKGKDEETLVNKSGWIMF